jgi:hypothetical protein
MILATSKLKGEEEPKCYLGATIDKYNLDGKICWSISAKSYLEKAIPTVEEEFGNLFKAFDKKVVSVNARTHSDIALAVVALTFDSMVQMSYDSV